jgi:arylsulfatase A-like enzyme
MKALDDAGIADNTLVVFTSDNGGLATAEHSPTCNAPARDGKGWMYEGGTRVPFLVRWPGHVQPNSSCPAPITSPDLYPTFLAAAQAPLPHTTLDGLSLLPLFEGSASSLPRNALFWHYPHYGNQGGTPGSSILAGDWKLIEFYDNPRLELYNLKQDFSETQNLAPTHPDLTKKLHDQLTTWRDSLNGKLPTPNPNYPKN